MRSRGIFSYNLLIKSCLWFVSSSITSRSNSKEDQGFKCIFAITNEQLEKGFSIRFYKLAIS